MENKHEKRQGGGSAFFWGLVIGALLATLLTTKKGRLILRELVNLGLELIEDIIEEKRQAHSTPAPVKQGKKEVIKDYEKTADDLESEITELESAPVVKSEETVISFMHETEKEPEAEIEAPQANSNGNGHHKKRLFRGLRRK